MDELKIVNRVSNNPEAFWEIIEEYQSKLLRYIMRLSDISYEEAENLLQDIFIKVYRNINAYDSKLSFSSWIFRIAHNTTIDHFRKNQKMTWNISLDDEEFSNLVNSLTDWANPHVDLSKKDVRDCVQKWLSLLSQEYKEMLLLRYMENYSYEEISDILKIPVWTVWTLISRAKKQLKEILEKFHCI